MAEQQGQATVSPFPSMRGTVAAVVETAGETAARLAAEAEGASGAAIQDYLDKVMSASQAAAGVAALPNIHAGIREAARRHAGELRAMLDGVAAIKARRS